MLTRDKKRALWTIVSAVGRRKSIRNARHTIKSLKTKQFLDTFVIAGCKNSIPHIENRFSSYFFLFFYAVWALTSGGFRIVSDTLVAWTCPVHQLAPKSVKPVCFKNITFTGFVTDERTHGRTNGQAELFSRVTVYRRGYGKVAILHISVVIFYALRLESKKTVGLTAFNDSSRPCLRIYLSADCSHDRGLCRRAVSVCLSVCLSRSCIVSKRANVLQNFFRRRMATTFYFFSTKYTTIFRQGPHDGGVEYRWGMKKSRLSTNSSLYLGNDAR